MPTSLTPPLPCHLLVSSRGWKLWQRRRYSFSYASRLCCSTRPIRAMWHVHVAYMWHISLVQSCCGVTRALLLLLRSSIHLNLHPRFTGSPTPPHESLHHALSYLRISPPPHMHAPWDPHCTLGVYSLVAGVPPTIGVSDSAASCTVFGFATTACALLIL